MHGRGPRLGRAALVLVAVLSVLPWAATAFGAGGPEVETEPVLLVTKTTAKLTGTVNPKGVAVTSCQFEYGTSPGSLSSTAECSPKPGAGTTPVAVSAEVTGLKADTTYYFEVVATSEEGTGDGAEASFKTVANAPLVTTEKAEAKLTSAVLVGSVNPEGASVSTCEFKYGTAPGSLTSHVACSPMPGSGTTPEAVMGQVSGLTPDTTYYFELVAEGQGGSSKGGEEHLTTLADGLAVTTEAATGVAKTSATLNGTVNPGGSPVTSCEFLYGTTKGSLTGKLPCSTLPGEGTRPVTVSAEATGLAPNTKYYFKLVADNEAAEPKEGAEAQLTTEPNAPVATTETAREVKLASAVLVGTVNPEGANVSTCEFRYGRPGSLISHAACSPMPAKGATPEAVTAQVSGLTPDTTYAFQVVAIGEGGEDESTVGEFTTPADDLAVATGEATGATKTSATLNGTVNPGGSPVTSCEFLYGTTAGSPTGKLPCSTLPGEGTQPVTVSAEATGLAPNTKYYFKLVADNEAAEPKEGAEAQFTTQLNPPAVVTGEASALAETSATISATVNPEGEQVQTCAVEYGSQPSLGTSVACPSSPGNGTSPVAVAVQLTGLSPGTTYYYRVIAKSPGGEEIGRVASFATVATPVPPPSTGPPPAKGLEPARPPTLTSLAESNAVFRVGRSSTAPSGRISRVSPTGTLFSFVLDQAAVVTVTITREESGHRIGKSCVVGRRGAGKPACVRSYVAMMLGRRARDGVNKLPFTGRVRGRALKSGAYRATFTAESLAGSSPASTISFRVVAH